MTLEQARHYRFDILAITQIWHNGDFPPIEPGRPYRSFPRYGAHSRERHVAGDFIEV